MENLLKEFSFVYCCYSLFKLRRWYLPRPNTHLFIRKILIYKIIIVNCYYIIKL